MAALIMQAKNLLKSSRCFSNIATNKVNPVVTTVEGKIRGATDQLYDGSTYYSFKGIPYAEPPVGKFRFKDPKPHKGWIGVHDSIKHGPVCPQIEFQFGTIKEGNEDCLFLNVYTRSLQPDSKIPVIVFIHGGGFLQGSGDSHVYGPKFLLQHDVILVTINYRLEAFGFLAMDTPEVPGNAGIKDQVVALRWVQRNIAQFGGDPDNVTIFGESAGAACVSYHLFSKMTDNLFHKAIIQSGSCVSDWAIDRDAKARAFRVGKHFGKDTNNPAELLDFLQTIPSSKLISLTNKTAAKKEMYRDLPIYFSPIIEKRFKNVESYIVEDRLKLFQGGKIKKVPTIVGYNSSEGLVAAHLLTYLDVLNRNPSLHVPQELADKISQEKMFEFGNRIKKYYFNNKDIPKEDKVPMGTILSDLHFLNGVYKFADLYSEINKSTYMYRFNCVTKLNFMKFLTNSLEYEGACHSDQLFYTFNNPMNKDAYAKHENLRNLVAMVTKLWTDFAKTGNPTPDNSLGVKWLPYTKANRQYLKIEPKPSMGSNDELDRLEFWRQIYKEAELSRKDI